jgi:hypothetical protein
MITNQCQYEPYSTTSSLQICKWCHRLKGEHYKDTMSNKKKQNSIDWLVEELRKYIEEPWKYVPIGGKEAIIEKAKAMHKQECVHLLNTHNDIVHTSEDHYNATFGGKQ